MISDTIVSLSVAFALAFTLAWLLVPRLRVRIEQPKYDFLDLLSKAESQSGGKERP